MGMVLRPGCAIPPDDHPLRPESERPWPHAGGRGGVADDDRPVGAEHLEDYPQEERRQMDAISDQCHPAECL